jgi:hypothetical protein
LSIASDERTDEFTGGGEPPQRSRFPWWLVLLGLVLVALIAILLFRGDGDGDGGTTPPEQEVAEDAEGTTADDGEAAQGEEGADDAEGETDGADDTPVLEDVRPGTITAGGATVYPLQTDLTVADYDGVDVTGRAIPVESVVTDTGFWVGESDDDRIFVLVTGSAIDLEPGDTIDFEGVVVEHGRNFAERIGVERNEGARRLTELAGHIEIPTYRISSE